MHRGMTLVVAGLCAVGLCTVTACSSDSSGAARRPAAISATDVAGQSCAPVYVTGDDLSDRDPVAAVTTWSVKSRGQATFSSTTAGAAALVVGQGSRARLPATKLVTSATHAPALQANGGGQVLATGATLSTSGGRSTGVSVQENGSLACIKRGSVSTAGTSSPALAVSAEGTLLVQDADVTTAGRNSPVLSATGGTTSVRGGSLTAERSPGVLASVPLTLTSVVLTTPSTAVTLSGSRAQLTLTDARVLSRADGLRVTGGATTATVTGGSITASNRLFAVDGGSLQLALESVQATTGDGALVEVGSGASAALTITDSDLRGNATLAKGGRSLTVELDNSATWTGALDAGALTIDGSSTWQVNGDSVLTDAVGLQISGNTVTNVVGNGHRVSYDETTDANQYLDRQSYRLSDGGTLVPR